MENQNPELKRQDRQNLKTKYKNQRLQEAKQIYLCECQKVYLSFPALYLHVKNKHRIKLTTKITDKICKMEERNGKTYITYFLIEQNEQQRKSQGQNQSEEVKKSFINSGIRTSSQENEQKTLLKTEYFGIDTRKNWKGDLNDIPHSWIKSTVEQFLCEVAYPTLESYQLLYKIVTHFLNYIQICSQNSKQFETIKIYQPQSLVNSLPMYFNEFLCFYIPRYGGPQMQHPEEKMRQIQVMKLFGSWLVQKRYTTYLALTGM